MKLTSSDSSTQFKFMKSKESVKTLMLHIIGLVIHMSTGEVAYGHFLAKILKKDTNELKSYFKELGVYTENKPRPEKSTEALDKSGAAGQGKVKVENVILVSFKKI